LCLEVPVLIESLPSASSAKISEQTRTMIVLAAGAVVRMSSSIAAGQQVRLTHLPAKKSILCRVNSVRQNPNAPAHVELEFLEPGEGFWGVYFPPDASKTVRAAAAPVAATRPVAAPHKAAPAATPSLSAPPKPKPAPAMPAPPAKKPAAPVSYEANPPGEPKDIVAVADAIEVQRKPALAPAAAKPAMAPAAPAAPKSATPPPPKSAPPTPTAAAPAAKPNTAEEQILAEIADLPPVTATRGIASTLFVSDGALAPERSGAARKVIWATAALVLLGGAIFASLQLRAPQVSTAATSAVETQPAPTLPPSPEATSPVAEPAPAPAATEILKPADPPVAKADSAKPPEASRPPAPAPAAESPAPAPPPQRPALTLGNTATKPQIRAPQLAATESAVELSPAAAPAADVAPAGLGNLVTASPAPAVPAAPVVKHAVIPPRQISTVPPVYPPLARQNRIEGDVVIDAEINEKGRVSSMKIVSGPPMLQQAARDALQLWRYEPARQDGKPVPGQVRVTIQFRLKQ
jgi:protein TonB